MPAERPGPDGRGPVLLLGIAPRSGTNFVYNLLRTHPELACVTSAEIPEHFIVKHSPLLVRYAGTLSAHWGQYWRPVDRRDSGAWSFEERRARILAGLGEGLLSVIAPRDDRVVVTKTPSVDGLAHAFELFPAGRVIVVVRDGRGVCESAHRSGGDRYELTMQRWARAARTILDVRSSVPADRLRIVRYEDVVVDPAQALAELCDFVGVSVDRIDRAAVDRLPVFGSSEHYGRDEQRWQVSDKTADFDPLHRWTDWPHERLERFDHVAGRESAALGYHTAVERHTPIVVQRARSVPWIIRSASKRALTAAQRVLYRVDVFGRHDVGRRIA